MFGDTNVNQRRTQFKMAMKRTGFAEASTNRTLKGGWNKEGHDRDDDVYHYHLKGFRPDADASLFTEMELTGTPARKASPFQKTITHVHVCIDTKRHTSNTIL